MELFKDRTKVILITHYMTRAKGSEETDQRTLNYVLKRVKKVFFIAHPFPNSSFSETIFEVYEEGNLIHEQKIPSYKGFYLTQYLIQVFLTIWLFIKIRSQIDLCIVLENLSFISLFPFRILGLIKRIVYYSVDFTPQRFSNNLINNFYHLMDRFACTHSDINWVMVKEQINARVRRDPKNTKYSGFALAPIGYKTDLIDIISVEKINFYQLIFAGALLENSGPQLGIEALPSLIKKFPQINYTIIGKGEFEKNLRDLTKKLGVQKFVKFLGYIDSFKNMTKIISKGSIGLAPFVPVENSLSYFSDPSKIKLYLVCGLPVITTNVATIAPLVHKRKAGLVVNYTAKELTQAISIMLSDKKKYQKFKNSAIKLSQKYNINNILKNAFNKIPN